MAPRIEQAFAPNATRESRPPIAVYGPAAFVVVLLVLATASNGAFAVRQWAPPALFAVVVLAVLFGSGGGAAVRSRWAGVALGAFWGFAGWSLLSALWAKSPSLAVTGGLRDALYAAVITLALVAVPDRRGLSLAGYGVVIAIGGLAVGTLVFIVADGPSMFLAGRLDAPVGYRNATALLFALPFWPLISIMATRDRSRGIRALAFAIAVLCLALAFLTQSRGVVLGFATGGVVALVLPPDRIRRAWLAILAVLMVVAASSALLTPYDAFDSGRGVVEASDISTAALVLVLLTIGAFLLGLAVAVFDNGLRAAAPGVEVVRNAARMALVLVAVLGVVGGLVAVGDPVAEVRSKWNEFKANETTVTGATRLTNAGGQRYDLWRVALDEFRDAPIGGSGRDNYAFGYYRDRTTDRNLDTAHSLVFETLGETGAVGLLLLMLGFFGLFAMIATGWRAAPVDVQRQATGLAAAGVVLVGQSLVDWMWRIPGLTSLGLLSLAASAALVAPAAPSRPRPMALAPRVASAAALSLLALLIASTYLGDHYISSARATSDPTTREQRAKRAATFLPLSVTPLYLQASADETRNDRAGARRELQKALEREPANVATIGLLGDFEARGGNYARAREYYARALALNPLDVGLQALAKSGGRPGS